MMMMKKKKKTQNQQQLVSRDLDTVLVQVRAAEDVPAAWSRQLPEARCAPCGTRSCEVRWSEMVSGVRSACFLLCLQGSGPWTQTTSLQQAQPEDSEEASAHCCCSAAKRLK